MYFIKQQIRIVRNVTSCKMVDKYQHIAGNIARMRRGGEGVKCTNWLRGKTLRQRNHLEELGLRARKILKWI